MILLCVLVLAVIWFVVASGRLLLVSKYVNQRIEEVYSSPNWYKFDVDINKAYDRDIWDLRKWKYRSFFPEVVK
jgi:hypothetical protein